VKKTKDVFEALEKEISDILTDKEYSIGEKIDILSRLIYSLAMLHNDLFRQDLDNRDENSIVIEIDNNNNKLD
jgi:hypothetical protein